MSAAAAAACGGRGTKRRFERDNQEQEEVKKMDQIREAFGFGKKAKKPKTENKPPATTAATAPSPLVPDGIDKLKQQLEEAEEEVRTWSKEVKDAYNKVIVALSDWEEEDDSKKKVEKEKVLNLAREREASAKQERDRISVQVEHLKAEIAAGATLVGSLQSTPSFEDVVQPILTGVRWPDPDNVKLKKFMLSSGNRHSTKINQQNVPMIPGELPPKPYFLMHELHPNAERIQSLKNKSNNNAVVVFAESGAGKTRSLIELLCGAFGTLLVCREPGKYTKNYGSLDLTSISNELSKLVPLESDLHVRRHLAERGIRCILRTRIQVKDAWEKATGREITPLQWLLVQLHPVHFFERDIFNVLAVEVFRKVKEDHHFHLPSAYLVAVDEAQILSKILQGGFASSQTDRPNSLRSLLSPVITAVESVGGHPIIAGTGLSMLQTLKSAAGSTTATPNIYESIVFDSFPPATAKEAEQAMRRMLETSVGATSLKVACQWLAGRHRFLTRFLERAMDSNETLDEALMSFVRLMTEDKLDSGTTRFLVEKLVRDQRLSQTPVTFWDPTAAFTAPPIEARDVFQSFKMAAWAQCNGEMVHRMQFAHATALIECGLANNTKREREDGLVAARFEPLVLEATRKSLFDEDHIRQYLLDVQNQPTALGFRFEQTAPFLMIPKMFPPDGRIPFETNPMFFGEHHAAHVPVEFKGVWRPFPVYFGHVASRGPLFPWFKENLARAKIGEPVSGLYPDNRAGPDFSVFLQHLIMADTEDVAAKLVPTGVVGVAHFQLKYAKAVDLEIAKRTVDPTLFYHVNRGKATQRVMKKYKEAYDEFLQLSESVPVFRIVVWVGGSDSTPDNDVTVDVVAGSSSTSKQDLCLVFNREDALIRLFGDDFFRMLQKLKKVDVSEDENDE